MFLNIRTRKPLKRNSVLESAWGGERGGNKGFNRKTFFSVFFFYTLRFARGRCTFVWPELFLKVRHYCQRLYDSSPVILRVETLGRGGGTCREFKNFSSFCVHSAVFVSCYGNTRFGRRMTFGRAAFVKSTTRKLP